MFMHSLREAVDRGIVSEEGAFGGLSPDEMAALQHKMPEAQVLVVFRSITADWRKVMPAKDFPGYRLDKRNTLEAVRYVSAAAIDEGARTTMRDELRPV